MFLLFNLKDFVLSHLPSLAKRGWGDLYKETRGIYKPLLFLKSIIEI